MSVFDQFIPQDVVRPFISPHPDGGAIVFWSTRTGREDGSGSVDRIEAARIYGDGSLSPTQVLIEEEADYYRLALYVAPIIQEDGSFSLAYRSTTSLDQSIVAKFSSAFSLLETPHSVEGLEPDILVERSAGLLTFTSGETLIVENGTSLSILDGENNVVASLAGLNARSLYTTLAAQTGEHEFALVSRRDSKADIRYFDYSDGDIRRTGRLDLSIPEGRTITSAAALGDTVIAVSALTDRSNGPYIEGATTTLRIQAIDPQGNITILDEISFPVGLHGYSNSIVATPDGGFALAIHRGLFSGAADSFFVRRYDAEGNFLAEQVVGEGLASNYRVLLYDHQLSVLADGSLLFSGSTFQKGGIRGGHLVEILSSDFPEFHGTDRRDVLQGTATGDTIFGYAGDDVLKGRAGDDLIAGGSGRDILKGGAGYDTLSYEDVTHGTRGVTVNLATGHTGRGSGGDRVSGFENVIGSPMAGSADVIRGNGGNNVIRGLAGDDRLQGAGGNDILYGDEGDDGLHTAAIGRNSFGRDRAYGGDGNDEIIGSNGPDYLYGEAGDDSLNGGDDGRTADTDFLFGGEGNDTLVSGQGRSVQSGYEARGDRLSGQNGDDRLYGGRANDTLDGGAGSDWINGRGGDDLIYTAGPNRPAYAHDRAYGGQGRDTLHGSNGRDYLDGGAGKDSLYGGDDGRTADRDILKGGSGDDWLSSGQVDSVKSGYEDRGGDLLYGERGDDLLYGGLANDKLFGGKGNDDLTGGGGDDRLFGGRGKDQLNGLLADDTLFGGKGNDKLYGHVGNDRLIGGLGRDKLFGGAGEDVFVFETVMDSPIDAPDRIRAGYGDQAFAKPGRAGGDRIDISGIDADMTVAGDQAFSFDSRARGGVFLRNEKGDTIVYLNVDDDDDFEFKLLIEDGERDADAYGRWDFIL